MRTVRVRMVPAAHAYVESLKPLHPSTQVEVVHLSDPPVPGAPPGQWWPHPVLEPGWVRAHADEQEIVHTHFGLEGRTTEQLEEWLDALAEVGLPLVHTVHDLLNPHLHDQTRHREHLELLVTRSAGLLTLTRGAAQEVERRYGRRPLVVAHPHVTPLDLVGLPRPPHTGPLRVGLHLKSLRTNLAPMRSLPALLEAVERLDGHVQLEIRAHLEVVEPFADRHDPALAGLLAQLREQPRPGVTVVVCSRLSDDELWAYLGGLDVSVLPYAWGTHSGWVEACRDLGTWVLAPDVGYLTEQGGVLTWGPPEVPPSVDRLVTLLTEAATGPPRVSRAEREDERDRVAAAHAQVYAAVLAGERVDASWVADAGSVASAGGRP